MVVVYHIFVRGGKHQNNQKICRADADHGIQYLFNNLGYGGLHHTAVRLEISSQHAQKSVQKNRGSKDSHDLHRRSPGQKARAEKQYQARQSAHNQHIINRTGKYPVCIPVFMGGKLLGDNLGDGRRDAVRRYQKYHGIDIVRCLVIAVSFITDNSS